MSTSPAEPTRLGVAPPLRMLIDCAAPHRGRFAAGILAVAVADLGQLLIPAVVQRAVDALGSAQAAQVFRSSAWQVAALTVVMVVSRFLWRHYLSSAARLCEQTLRSRLLHHLLRLPSAWYAQARNGEVLSLATTDAPTVRMALYMAPMAGFDAVFFTLGTLLAMVRLDLHLTLWTVLPFPLLGLLVGLTMRVVRLRWKQVQQDQETVTEKVRESVAGMRVLRSFVQAEGDVRDFERLVRACHQSQEQFVAADAITQPVILLLTGTSAAILLSVGGSAVIHGTLSLGTFAAFTSYLGMLSWPMLAAGWSLSLVQRGAASMERIEAFLATPRESDSAEGGGEIMLLSPPSGLEEASPPSGLEEASPPSGEGLAVSVEARNLSFHHPQRSEPALDGLCFHVRPGGSLGVVGRVGSGKSTLAHLLSRLYDPPAGTLMLAGKDVLNLPRTVLRGAISYVPQEAFLFSTTIHENLLLGNPTASKAQLEEACRIAEVHDEILAFPKGYQTLLGERGVSLSGGQRQRLALARALLKPAPVLVLDDTLSAVDASTEARILKNLRLHRAQCTCFVFAHRLSAVRDLDRIIVLDDGRVADEGTHLELIARPGYYRQVHLAAHGVALQRQQEYQP